MRKEGKGGLRMMTHMCLEEALILGAGGDSDGSRSLCASTAAT